MQLQEFDCLTSICDRVTLINGDIGRDRIICGAAFFDAHVGDVVYFPNNIAITIATIHQHRPVPITLSSEHDNIEFALCPSN